MKIFAKIRYYLGLVALGIAVCIFMIPLIAIFRRKKGIIIHYINKILLWFMGGKVTSSGQMDTNADMFLFNHQGVYDIIAMEALQKNHIRWIAKQELFDMFYVGNLLKFGEMISVKREDKRGLLKLLQESERSRKELNRQVAIFPEGTRAKGQQLLPFKQGAKLIAQKLGLRVQPVVITGSKVFFDEHKKLSKRGIINYHFLPSVDVKNAPEDWYENLQVTMQEVLDDEYSNHNRSR